MWEIETTDEFDDWFESLGDDEKVETIAKVELLKLFGPMLKRPHADTLNGSRYPNMKELRAKTRASVFRVAFAFDPLKTAILLIGGDKKGVSEKTFYRQLLAKADKLYERHLKLVEKKKGYGDKYG